METCLWPTIDHLDPPDLPRHGCNSDRGPAASGGPTVLANDRNGGGLRLNASRHDDDDDDVNRGLELPFSLSSKIMGLLGSRPKYSLPRLINHMTMTSCKPHPHSITLIIHNNGSWALRPCIPVVYPNYI